MDADAGILMQKTFGGGYCWPSLKVRHEIILEGTTHNGPGRTDDGKQDGSR